jgi:hypothetical protein
MLSAVLAMPQYICECGAYYDLSWKRKKYSRRQLSEMKRGGQYQGLSDGMRRIMGEEKSKDKPIQTEQPEIHVVVVSCESLHCSEYGKFKVLRLPVLQVPTAEVEL